MDLWDLHFKILNFLNYNLNSEYIQSFQMAVCKENCCETENVLSKLQQLKEQAEVLIHFDIIIKI